MPIGEIDEERIKDLDLHVAQFFGLLQDKSAPLLRREQGLLLADRFVHDTNDHLVEDARGARDDVEVAVGDRVIGARADRNAAVVHGWGSPAEYTAISVSP
jgi:hypothetical protein